MKLILIAVFFYLLMKIFNSFIVSNNSKKNTNDKYIDAEFEEVD